MRSVHERIAFSKFGLDLLNPGNKLRFFVSDRSRDHDSPTVDDVRDNRDGGMRRSDNIAFPKSLVDQVNELVSRHDFSLHRIIIAETAGLAKQGGPRGA
jgi:hypothetical protein